MYISIEQYKGFEIKLEFLNEDIPLEDMFEPEDAQSVAEKIEGGGLQYFCAKVSACYEGKELGASHLGACTYEGETDFKADSYYMDMVGEAVNEAQAFIKRAFKLT